MLFPRIRKKPSIFTNEKAWHRHVISGLPQEREVMWSRALTYLAAVIDHVGSIQIRFSTVATVSRVSEKSLRRRANARNVSFGIALQ